MKTTGSSKLLVAAICLIGIFFLSTNRASARPDDPLRPKNIVLIMLDDADNFDFGFNQTIGTTQDAVTPNMDALRQQGRLFSQFRTASAVCSPTRISVLTGCNPIRFGAIDAWSSETSESGLPDSIPQLGNIMQLAGKKTGFFGKWHVGISRASFQPAALGFERFCRYERLPDLDYDSWTNPFRFISDSEDVVRHVDFIDRHFTDKAIDFVRDCNQTKEDFFLYFTPLTPHFPWSPPSDYMNVHGFDLSQPRGRLLAMMHTVDQEIGRLINELRDNGQLDDTLIMFTSDNGGPRLVQNTDRYFGGSKGTLLDGGLRVPLVATWPGHIPANSSNDSFLVSYDLLPTLAELGGLNKIAVENRIDGKSFARALTNDQRYSHSPTYWELSGSAFRVPSARWGRTQAYQEGNYKIVKLEGRSLSDPNGVRLFNLRTDPRERNNLANSAAHQTLWSAMRRNMLAVRKEIARYEAFPNFVSSPTVVAHDPRIDVAERDMTLEFDLLMPENLDRAQNIYFKPGSQRLTLTPAGTLIWRINGWDPMGVATTVALRSSQNLQPGLVHKVVLSIGGYRNDFAKIELYLDGQKEADADDTTANIFALRSSLANATVGDIGIVLDRVIYSTLRLWRTEWE